LPRRCALRNDESESLLPWWEKVRMRLRILTQSVIQAVSQSHSYTKN